MRNKIRIYDCSNSSERPAHREVSKGPKENDIMRGLKKHAGLFFYEFVDQPQDAEVIITNDVYPSYVLALDRPRVKRMDGVFFLESLKARNEPLNQAAKLSTCVIFISEYSRWSFRSLYQTNVNDSWVVPNCVDDSVYFPIPKYLRAYRHWVASASNWAREEKRYEDLMTFATEVMSPSQELFVIGECPTDFVPRVDKVGYIDDEDEMNRVLNMGSRFINLSYRDPAPKVVCQAVNCQLPILYADSGGTHEMVNSGVAIEDPFKMVFEGNVPKLSVDKMREAYVKFEQNYRDLAAKARVRKYGYMEMIASYFWVISEAISNYRREQMWNEAQEKLAKNA